MANKQRRVTLGEADLPSDSDPDDEDYVAETSEDGHNHSRKQKESYVDRPLSGATIRAWEVMCAEDVASLPPHRVHQDSLMRSFHKRHQQSPKGPLCPAGVFAELRKYSNIVEDDAPSFPKPIQMKKLTRCTNTQVTAHINPKPLVSAATVVEDTVRFAGEKITVNKVLKRGSLEELRHMQSQKRVKKAEVGGQLSGLDAFLRSCKDVREFNIMDKSGYDWQTHKNEAGVSDLEHDRHAGALERKEFIARATVQAETVVRNGEWRAAKLARAAAARAAASNKIS